MYARYQLWAVWCGPLFLVLYIAAFGGIAGFIPPPDPLLTGDQLAALFDAHRNAIRAGNLLGMVFSILLLPWFAVIAAQMAKIEGERQFPFLATIQFGAGVILVTLFLLVGVIWNVAAFRPEESAARVIFSNDLAWLTFVMPYPEYTLQLATIALAGFMDKSENPIFPRWACYFNIWIGVSAIGGGFATFFKTGPFAWDGIIAFWVPVVCFASWIIVMSYLLRRGILREQKGHLG